MYEITTQAVLALARPVSWVVIFLLQKKMFFEKFRREHRRPKKAKERASRESFYAFPEKTMLLNIGFLVVQSCLLGKVVALMLMIAIFTMSALDTVVKL